VHNTCSRSYYSASFQKSVIIDQEGWTVISEGCQIYQSSFKIGLPVKKYLDLSRTKYMRSADFNQEETS
jgi:hypothetical protein